VRSGGDRREFVAEGSGVGLPGAGLRRPCGGLLGQPLLQLLYVVRMRRPLLRRRRPWARGAQGGSAGVRW